MIINELGLMAEGDGDNPQGAEEKLVELLSDSQEEIRWIAACYLQHLTEIIGRGSAETKEAIAAYKRNPTCSKRLPTEAELLLALG
jgi:hypothetical protein